MSKPKIRFKGFEDDWEQRKVGELLEERNEQAPMSEDYPLMAFIANQGVAPKGERYDRSALVNDETGKKYKRTEFGDFIYSSNNLETGSIGLNKYGNACISPVYSIFKPTGKAELDFLGRRFLRKDFINEMVRWRQGVVYGQWKIHETDFMKIEIRIPSVDEQKKIGQYFDSLDHLITLHQRRCDETLKLKKFMLQKMFPQNEQNVPEIRFKGFTDPWEQRKLGEITELKSASRVHKDEWTSNGVPFYRSSDVMAAINGTENEKAFISEELYEKLSKVSGKLEEGDILVTGGGSVGNPYIVPDNKPLYTKDADLLWIKNKGKFHPYFLYEFFFSPTFRNYLGSISHVGTIAHYTITQLSDTPICLPSFEEQKKVGEYFQSLDHLITLHQHKCDELQKIKKFMLQKMFVQEK